MPPLDVLFWNLLFSVFVGLSTTAFYSMVVRVWGEWQARNRRLARASPETIKRNWEDLDAADAEWMVRAYEMHRQLAQPHPPRPPFLIQIELDRWEHDLWVIRRHVWVHPADRLSGIAWLWAAVTCTLHHYDD